MFDNEMKLTTPILKNSEVPFAAVGDTLQESNKSTLDSSRREWEVEQISISTARQTWQPPESEIL